MQIFDRKEDTQYERALLLLLEESTKRGSIVWRPLGPNTYEFSDDLRFICATLRYADYGMPYGKIELSIVRTFDAWHRAEYTMRHFGVSKETRETLERLFAAVRLHALGPSPISRYVERRGLSAQEAYELMGATDIPFSLEALEARTSVLPAYLYKAFCDGI